MSKVSIKIGPKTYTVATADGDEAKIAALGAMIDAKYQMLGNARAVQETDNLVFASLFLADELEEARKEVAKVEAALIEARAEFERSGENTDTHNSDLDSELEALRQAEAQARAENAALKAELVGLREASRTQPELFGEPKSDEEFTDRIEALALRAEEIATALEAGALEGGATAD